LKQVDRAVPGEDTIRAYFGLDGVALALRSSNWEVREEVERLVEFSRDSDPKVAMAAMKQLRGVVRETAEINGIIQSQNAEITHQEGDRVVKISASAKLVQSLRETTNHVKVPDSLPFAAQFLPARDSAQAAHPAPESGVRADQEPSAP
jgi:hypothetical protein